ncbi:hypothetical protein FZEAL_5514 [Fusarium zealandicum]|uniref:Uncharacterized protein n=1 Tax=Fusarium zealandicum TaxID=1053134 RepID=A0A8H4XKS6_9HYPO|nr:hypothetical protein FZEAL_5514 [Fusarium zealandicum]
MERRSVPCVYVRNRNRNCFGRVLNWVRPLDPCSELSKNMKRVDHACDLCMAKPVEEWPLQMRTPQGASSVAAAASPASANTLQRAQEVPQQRLVGGWSRDPHRHLGAPAEEVHNEPREGPRMETSRERPNQPRPYPARRPGQHLRKKIQTLRDCSNGRRTHRVNGHGRRGSSSRSSSRSSKGSRGKSQRRRKLESSVQDPERLGSSEQDMASQLRAKGIQSSRARFPVKP